MKVHGLDPKDASLYNLWTSDYAAVLADIKKLVHESGGNEVFVHRKDFWTAKKSLEFLGKGSVVGIEVLCLEDLYIEMKEAAAKLNPSLGKFKKIFVNFFVSL